MSIRDLFSDLSAPELSDPDPVRRAQIQMKQPQVKRFYKDVSVGEVEDGHAILLDGRPVKTPAKKILAVPTAPAAGLLAAEWDAQKEHVNPVKMPFTRLVNTAIDGIGDDVDPVFADIVNFAGTDLVCYRAGDPQSLVEMQARNWDPVLAWSSESLGAEFRTAVGIMHTQQPQSAIDAFAATLSRHRTALALAALHTVTTLTGSALIALAFAERRLSAEEAWRLAHVDEDWNILQWGTDAEAQARRAARWVEMRAAAELFDALT
jgi:chaperone required for assembly of F1-ATPase